jgi:uncharacterized FlgJ-related protein
MKQVFRELKKRGLSPKYFNALEIFGGSGDGHLKDYASLVSTLEVWEIDPIYEKILRQNFPRAEVKITDSYKEIKITSKKYNFIVVDNGFSTRTTSSGICCEHFDFFPDIFRIAMDSSVFILNVIPEVDSIALKEYPYLFNDTQLLHRKNFYKTNRPEKITFEEMIEAYRKMLIVNNFNLEWYFFRKRNFHYYIVLKIMKSEV